MAKFKVTALFSYTKEYLIEAETADDAGEAIFKRLGTTSGEGDDTLGPDYYFDGIVRADAIKDQSK